MSWCRWSSMDWRCDLYVYEDVNGGVTIHVAGMRRVGDIPTVGDILELDADEWAAQYQAQMDALDALPLEPIGGPFDGALFNEDDAEGLTQRFTDLREAGYLFPDYLFEYASEYVAEL